MVVAQERIMGNKAAKGESVRLPNDVVRMARMIATYLGTGIGDVIGDASRQSLEKLMKEYKLPLPKPNQGEE